MHRRLPRKEVLLCDLFDDRLRERFRPVRVQMLGRNRLTVCIVGPLLCILYVRRALDPLLHQWV